MAESLTFNGWPKGVLGDLARDTTDRPAKLRMKATADIAPESTVGRGERKVKGKKPDSR